MELECKFQMFALISAIAIRLTECVRASEDERPETGSQTEVKGRGVFGLDNTLMFFVDFFFF